MNFAHGGPKDGSRASSQIAHDQAVGAIGLAENASAIVRRHSKELTVMRTAVFVGSLAFRMLQRWR